MVLESVDEEGGEAVELGGGARVVTVMVIVLQKDLLLLCTGVANVFMK